MKKQNKSKILIKRHGFTKYHYIKRIFKEDIIDPILNFLFPSRKYRFSDGIVKDGIDELLIPKNYIDMKKTNEKYTKDKNKDSEYHSIWIVKY